MSEFRSGEEVLQAARLQLDPLGEDCGGLVVEGAGDRKVFAPICVVRPQIIVAGGKSLVREAHRLMRAADIGRFVFLVDDDGDVERGELRPAPDLIITEHGDVEADLFALGGLELVVEQLVASVGSGDQDPVATAQKVYSRAVTLAEPIGRVRRAARTRSISLSGLKPWAVDYTAIDDATASVVQGAALRQVERAAGLTRPQARKIAEVLQQVPSGIEVCNGHDLVVAVGIILMREHRLASADVRRVDALLRMTMLDATRRESWSVVQRLRAWEKRNARSLLKR